MTDHSFPRRATHPERPSTPRLKSRRSPSLIGNGLLLLCSALAAAAGPGDATNAFAAPQDPSGFGGAGGTALANEVIEIKGTLKDARGNMVTVAGDDGNEYMVQYPDEITSLEFIAKALPAYLRRGMPIRFATVLGPTGMPMAPVNQIEVFAPINAKMLPHNQTERYTPGVHPADRKKRPRGAPLTGKVIVVGNLAMLNAQGGLALQAGSTPVQTMVAPDASLEIRVNNLSLAQPGDAVSVEGFYQPPDKTKVKANRIKITTDRIYGETPPKKIRQRPGKKTSDASPDTPDDAATPQNETAENETAKNEEAPTKRRSEFAKRGTSLSKQAREASPSLRNQDAVHRLMTAATAEMGRCSAEIKMPWAGCREITADSHLRRILAAYFFVLTLTFCIVI